MRLLLAASTALLLAGPTAAGPIQNRIYPAPTKPLSLAGLPEGASLVAVRTSDGLDLKGVAVPARDASPTLLVFHGNASSAADAARWFAPLVAKGYGLVVAEYRGYSGNAGSPDEAGLMADAEAFLALARSRAAGAPVWVVGHSLGGGVALGLSKRHKLEAVITIGTFTRLRAMAPKLARALVPDHYDNKAAVAALDEPYFLVHGTADDVVPASEGEQLHRAAGAAGKIGASFVVMGADHRPRGDQIAAIIAAASVQLRTGAPRAESLPAEVKLVPFGQARPLNP